MLIGDGFGYQDAADNIGGEVAGCGVERVAAFA